MSTATLKSKSPKAVIPAAFDIDTATLAQEQAYINALASNHKELFETTYSKLNLLLQQIDKWMYQAQAISDLADAESTGEMKIRLFPQMIGAAAELLRESINSSRLTKECWVLLSAMILAAESQSGVPKGS